jgi:hypothetical protein
MVPAHAADELHRSRPWALYWLGRFSKEGIEGLKVLFFENTSRK